MCVRYYVTDVTAPIISVNGFGQCNYEVVLGKNPALYYGELKVNTLHQEKGLHYIITSDRKHFTGATTKKAAIKTTKTVCAIPACGDYWKLVDTPDGTKAIRIHRINRKYLFTPKSTGTMP